MGPWKDPFAGSALFTPLEETEFAHTQTLDSDGLVDRCASMSFVAIQPEATCARVLAEIRDARRHPAAAVRGAAPDPRVHVHQALIAWARARGRDLPWRRTRDPWAILVSESMLQQTQVPRVVPKYEAFLARFPTPAACAAAPAGDVVTAWAGLGYNRRAINLHRAACVIGDGPFPDTLDGLLALPGVGPYTARAVLTFAFEADVGILEVNTDARPEPASPAARCRRPTPTPSCRRARAGRSTRPSSIWAPPCACADDPQCESCPVRRWCAGPGTAAAPPTKQSTFAGSDRQGRGRLVDALRAGPVRLADLATVMGWPGDEPRANRIADSLIRDGLAERRADSFVLPD